MTAEVESQPAQIKLAIPTHAPSVSGPSAFYTHLQKELARILAACADVASESSGQCYSDDAAVPGSQVGPLSAGAFLTACSCPLGKPMLLLPCITPARVLKHPGRLLCRL